MRKPLFTEKRIETLIRIWFAGAVFFFIGWGSGLAQASVYDYVFFLGLSMALAEMAVVDPVVRLALNVEGTNRTREKSVPKRVLHRLARIFRAIFLVAMIAVIYNVINRSLVLLFGLPVETVVLPAEPILFGILYLVLYRLIDSIKKNLHSKVGNEGNQLQQLEG